MQDTRRIIWLFGLPGAGKTTLAKKMAMDNDGCVVDSDDDGPRNGWPDEPIATHMLASRAFSKNGVVYVASLMPIKHPWIKMIGIDCPEHIRRQRKPEYYAAIDSGIWHRQENLACKSVDMFPGFDLAECIIEST